MPRVADRPDTGKWPFLVLLPGEHFGVEIQKLREVAPGRDRRLWLSHRDRRRFRESGQPFDHVLFPANALAKLAVADDVNARLDLPLNDLLDSGSKSIVEPRHLSTGGFLPEESDKFRRPN